MNHELARGGVGPVSRCAEWRDSAAQHASRPTTGDATFDPANEQAFGMASAKSAAVVVSAAQVTWDKVARNADFLPHHGRQAMLGNSAPQALDMGHLLASPALCWVTTAVVAIGIAVVVLHRHLRSRHLRSKVRYDLLPTTSFDPSLQGVLGFAHQLGRVRPVHGWVPASAVGVRIRFSTDDLYRKMIMSAEGRESITGVINKLVYPDVEIRRHTPVQGEVTVVDRGDLSSVDSHGGGRNLRPHRDDSVYESEEGTQ
ncbi:hypothetical protein [Amycolatopsis samaneae]|uniref:Uncharacterized protein n=1 Tax=Amycolatopsis samaneae TaxID=664691 RepID=A0ABW5GXW4_9PSEU